jgi:hypothetical protein
MTELYTEKGVTIEVGDYVSSNKHIFKITEVKLLGQDCFGYFLRPLRFYEKVWLKITHRYIRMLG